MIPDSVAVLLLLLALGALYGWWTAWRNNDLFYNEGYMAGHAHTVAKWRELLFPKNDDRHPRSWAPADEVYDWKVQGL